MWSQHEYEHDDGGLQYWQTVGQWEDYKSEETNAMLVKSNGNFEQAPIGSHMARCVRLTDLGTQESEYQGAKSTRRQLVLSFELPDEPMTTGESAGKPFLISKFYTASIGEKANLRHDLISWRGRDFTKEELDGFELQNILGKPCMLSIVKNDKGKSVISTISGVPKGVTVSPQINETIYFSLDEFDNAVFSKLGNKMQEMIKRSPEYRLLQSRSPAIAGDFDDDIPF